MNKKIKFRVVETQHLMFCNIEYNYLQNSTQLWVSNTLKKEWKNHQSNNQTQVERKKQKRNKRKTEEKQKKNRRETREKTNRFLPCGTNGSRSNSNLDDVSAGKNELFNHFTRHNISCHKKQSIFSAHHSSSLWTTFQTNLSFCRGFLVPNSPAMMVLFGHSFLAFLTNPTNASE